MAIFLKGGSMKQVDQQKTLHKAFTRDEVWLLVAIVLVAMALRPGIVSMGPALPAMIEAFQLSHASASMMTAIPDILMGVLALPTPWLVRKFGANKVLMTALAILTVCMLARAWAIGVGMLFVATTGVGVGIAVAGAMFAGIVKASFARRAALIMGIYAMALSLGSTLSALLTGWMVQSAGWRIATGMWAAVGIVAIVAWFRTGRTALLPDTQPLSAVPVTPCLPWRTPVAWMIALFFACINFLFYSLLTWTAAMYQEQGMSASEAGSILAGFTFCFMLASPVAGIFSRHHDRRPWLTGWAVLCTLGLAGIVCMPASGAWIWMPLAAFGLGGAFTLAMTLPLDHTHTPDEANQWNAFVLTIGYLIAATGPFALGWMHDRSGNFGSGYQLLVAVAVVMVLLASQLKPAVHHE